MILGHLPGSQDDAFFITHGLYRTFFYSALSFHHHYLRRCFTCWEGPDIACFDDAQICSFPTRSLDPHGRAVGSTLLTFVRISRRLTRGQPQVADNSRYHRMTTGVMKTITPNRYDDETTKHCQKNRTLL